MSVLKKCAYDVISCADHAFGFPILWRGMWAREAVDYAVVGEKCAESGGKKFTTVVALHASNDSVELGVNVREEALKGRGCLGFVT